MKKETSKLLKTYYFILDQILDIIISTDKKKLNTIFKNWYRTIKDVPHASLKDFEKEELNELINRLLIEFAVEYGIYLLQPNDPKNAEEISLSEYLEYKNWDMDSINSLIENFKELPEGFILIKSIDSLKRLKKGKRITKPENLEYNFGTIIYIYSPTKEAYYRKIFSNFTPINLLEDYIKKRLVYGPKPQNHD